MAADYVACADDCDDTLDVRVVPCPRADADAPPQPAPASPVAAHKERAKGHGQHDSSGKQQRATWSASIVLVVAFLSFASLVRALLHSARAAATCRYRPVARRACLLFGWRCCVMAKRR